METNKIKASLYNNQIISQTTNCPSFVSYIDEEIRKLSNAGRNGTAGVVVIEISRKKKAVR